MATCTVLVHDSSTHASARPGTSARHSEESTRSDSDVTIFLGETFLFECYCRRGCRISWTFLDLPITNIASKGSKGTYLICVELILAILVRWLVPGIWVQNFLVAPSLYKLWSGPVAPNTSQTLLFRVSCVVADLLKFIFSLAMLLTPTVLLITMTISVLSRTLPRRVSIAILPFWECHHWYIAADGEWKLQSGI